MNHVLYIPHHRSKETVEAIRSWLDRHPGKTMEQAVDGIFEIGVNVELAIKQAEQSI